MNMIILLPLNFTGNSKIHSAMGLDRLTISNIAPENIRRMNMHFIMSLVTILFFHWILVYEFQSYVTIRQSFLTSKFHKDTVLSKTLLLSNVPNYLLDPDVIRKVFEIVPGGVSKIWHVYDFRDVMEKVREAHDAVEILEEAEVQSLKMMLYESSRSSTWTNWFKKQKNENIAKNKLEIPCVKFFPPIYLKSFYIPKFDRYISVRLPGFLRIFFFQKRVPVTEWCINKLNENHKLIDQAKLDLSTGALKLHNKLFIEFSNQTGANIAHQCLLSQVQGNLDMSVIEIHPDDIIWQNIARNHSFACLTEKYLVTLIFIGIILLYVIPVSFIGLISQIPLLTKLIPSLGWMYGLPEGARKTIQSLLPSCFLAILTESVLIVFRFLTFFKGSLSGADLELNLQKWYFVFLFVQQFLVVTISSSITVIFKRIVDQPTSIPILLATNLPKATTFFYQYISVKALYFCGNNFLRIVPLFKTLLINGFVDETPRQKFKRLTSLPNLKWGSIYPVYSVFASIGIAYAIIAPLISMFLIFILSLSLLFYKYALRYIYNHVNVSDTKGRFYPVALLHLYTGIYCLECCLIGIFFLSKDDQNNSPMFIQSWIMGFVLIATIFGNLTLYSRYEKHFSFMPILADKKFEDQKEVMNIKDSKFPNTKKKTENEEALNGYSNSNLLFLHPALKYETPKIWLPEDPLCLSEERIKIIQQKLVGVDGGSVKGAKMELCKNKIKVQISEAPPDYK